MLVMRRRAGEGLLIGDDIEIEILEVGPTRVKLGIVAPANRTITRKEVILTRSENLTASRNASPEVIAWLSRRLAGPLSKDNCQEGDAAVPNQTRYVRGGSKNTRTSAANPDMEG